LSPVFRHGSLRLYLLRLLDEEPRHGYEVIRLLRDRFMGVYSPSPGTIYPRLARLEEEGLVTHDEVDGRKVYRITEAGREELRSRSDELDELEEELSASVSDIVREVREDVRQTVRSLREELTWAARESRRMGQAAAADAREQDAQRDQPRERQPNLLQKLPLRMQGTQHHERPCAATHGEAPSVGAEAASFGGDGLKSVVRLRSCRHETLKAARGQHARHHRIHRGAGRLQVSRAERGFPVGVHDEKDGVANAMLERCLARRILQSAGIVRILEFVLESHEKGIAKVRQVGIRAAIRSS